MTLDEVMKATDWALLAEQKRDLVEACSHGWDLEGLVNFIDAIQDAALIAGYPVVFKEA